MANIDAELKQPNGLSVDIDDNNNGDDKTTDIGNVIDKEDATAPLDQPAQSQDKEIDINELDTGIELLNLSSSNTSPVPPNTPAATTSPTPANSESFETIFKMFAKFGDIKSAGDAITLSNSDKWFKQAKIIDGKTISTTDTGIYFKQVAKTKKSLTLKEYNTFLEKLATVKKVDLDEMKNKLKNSGAPATNRTTTAVTSGAIGRLTDHTKYTGSHKQRFDKTGKGRGKAGREDVRSNTGYVTGFKS